MSVTLIEASLFLALLERKKVQTNFCLPILPTSKPSVVSSSHLSLQLLDCVVFGKPLVLKIKVFWEKTKQKKQKKNYEITDFI